ncbi:MAG: TraR/DksA C4-type zinc finger protein [Cyclobacteriaceae bacterium]
MSLDRSDVRKRIEEEIRKTKVDIEDLRNQSQPISPENSIGRISRMDAINNKSVIEASLRQSQDKLLKLEKALSKVDDEGFGICVNCKKPIPLGRIMLMPHAVRCVNCA